METFVETERTVQCLHFTLKLSSIPSGISNSTYSILLVILCVLAAGNKIYSLKCSPMISNCQSVTVISKGLKYMYKGLSLSLSLYILLLCTCIFFVFQRYEYKVDICQSILSRKVNYSKSKSDKGEMKKKRKQLSKTASISR